MQVNGSSPGRSVPPPPTQRVPSEARRQQTLPEVISDGRPPGRLAPPPPPPPGPSPAVARGRSVSANGPPTLPPAVSPAVAALRAQHTGPANMPPPSVRRSKSKLRLTHHARGLHVLMVFVMTVPEPPLTSGGQTWPKQTDLPPPRAFEPSARSYGSGKSRGCDFSVSSLD